MASDGDRSANALEMETLRAELAEAKHIGRWLYDRSPALRLVLGDVSEWPWLLEPKPGEKFLPPRLSEADRDRTVLRTFAVLQTAGDDPYDVGGVPIRLGLKVEEFEAALNRLIHAGLVTGGQLVRRSFVETVTREGMAAAGMLDDAGQPLRVLRANLAAFSGTGYGTLRVPAGVQLKAGQTIAVTDDEADTLPADVLKVNGDTAEVRVRRG